VFVLLWIDFRKLRLTLVAMAQLLTGVVLMAGMIPILGFELNYVNAFVATMILGVGIDYGIHLIHRLEETGGTVEQGTLETGKAVVIAALTNMAGFGTLLLGNYPALPAAPSPCSARRGACSRRSPSALLARRGLAPRLRTARSCMSMVRRGGPGGGGRTHRVPSGLHRPPDPRLAADGVRGKAGRDSRW
jgi:hypothetical protein